MKKILLLNLFFAALNTKAQTSFVYSDGNANSYGIDEKEIIYTPIKPEESSSGSYSGGEAKRKKISKDDFKKISVLFKETFAATAEQQDNRELGSGQLARYSKGKLNKKVVLKPSSEYKQKIEVMLKELLK